MYYSDLLQYLYLYYTYLYKYGEDDDSKRGG